MNRRDSLKAIGLTAISTGVLLEACKTDDKKATTATAVTADNNNAGREAFEVERNKKLNEERFFTDHEMLTITVLADIIIPKDEKSGSASDAKVPEFIEFIVKDIPSHQVPMRGGLRWLDSQCMNRYGTAFKDANPQQQLEMVNDIAWPEKVKPGMEQGVAFFNRMRDLTASGFFTSEMGVKDIGYAGNMPNKWEGVPADILKQYGLENV
ncbi:gluconate 2-dehydrogenase subunit 3 family protein [Agriterribacter sp.]|uniref:gluconate 2-dehydrogenase subunit 3 family protein n=1 Tax=Agriterribacter sp. TaxID=2821509 RepID=UPI002D075139|nr:gluconate 2-dehydrogenase subunit 3 family protein [Agriterribacter sp.]HRO48427.1 gluconate 2-dehydrogenase subunit 3 family protein [Agriterribacter sp.]HRQ19434.1 gluconate 2-dehydrogenase subunit 3 family protein [Agriterribacter sp.]